MAEDQSPVQQARSQLARSGPHRVACQARNIPDENSAGTYPSIKALDKYRAFDFSLGSGTLCY